MPLKMSMVIKKRPRRKCVEVGGSVGKGYGLLVHGTDARDDILKHLPFHSHEFFVREAVVVGGHQIQAMSVDFDGLKECLFGLEINTHDVASLGEVPDAIGNLKLA